MSHSHEVCSLNLGAQKRAWKATACSCDDRATVYFISTRSCSILIKLDTVAGVEYDILEASLHFLSMCEERSHYIIVRKGGDSVDSVELQEKLAGG